MIVKTPVRAPTIARNMRNPMGMTVHSMVLVTTKELIEPLRY